MENKSIMMKNRTLRREKNVSKLRTRAEKKMGGCVFSTVIPVKNFDPVLIPLIILVQIYLSWL